MPCQPSQNDLTDNLRWHIIYQVKMQGKPCRKVGKTLSVDKPTVSRTWTLSMFLATLTSESYLPLILAQMCLKSWWLFLKQYLKTEVLLHELHQIPIYSHKTWTCMCRCQYHLESLASFKLHKMEDGNGMELPVRSKVPEHFRWSPWDGGAPANTHICMRLEPV